MSAAPPGAGLAAGAARPYGRSMGGEREQDDQDVGTQPSSSGLVGRSIDEFVNQLRSFTDRARSVAGAVPSRLSLPALPSPPGAL